MNINRFLQYHHVIAIICLLFNVLPISGVKLSSFDFARCGGLATAVTDVLLYPIDTIKVKQQSSRTPLRIGQALSQILRCNGISGLFKGVAGYAGVDSIGAAVFFTSYETVKDQISMRIKSPFTPYLSASMAFLLSSSFMVPAELIKVKMQSHIFPSLQACISMLWKTDGRGIRGLYKGYGATLLRDLPYFALQLGCFDNIRHSLCEWKDKYKGDNSFCKWALESSQLDLISSLASGVITGILTNPMDVVTARLMTQEATSTIGSIISLTLWESRLGPTMATTTTSSIPTLISSVPYKGLRDCVVRMSREEGVGSFFAGVGARVMWIAPFTAISLSLNEAFRRHLLTKKLQRLSITASS